MQLTVESFCSYNASVYRLHVGSYARCWLTPDTAVFQQPPVIASLYKVRGKAFKVQI